VSLDRLAEALGWALVHSIWQLTLVGLVAALLLRWVGDARPRLQYALACAALALCLALPVAILIRHLLPVPGIPVPMPALPGASAAALAANGVASTSWAWGASASWTLFLPLLASAWALGALVMASRLAGGFITAGLWRRNAEAAPAAWQERVRGLATHMGLRNRVMLRLSTRVVSPVAIGLWRPMVLVPASLLTRLPEAYLEALLAHEIAHLARHDYLVNVLQRVVEVLVFHHPAVWWLSRQIRNLREHLCDDQAASVLGDPRRLALALNALATLPEVPAPQSRLALAARGGLLFNRIQRLLFPPEPRHRPSWIPAALLALTLPLAALSLKAATQGIPGDSAAIAELDALATREHLDPHLLRSLAWVESGLNRQQQGRGGALGLLQVSPGIARAQGATDLQDPAQVTAAGASYLRFLLGRYRGDVAKALAAFKGGVRAADEGNPTEEIRSYVALVMSVTQARAVQPAPHLPSASVDGVISCRSKGTYWVTLRTPSGWQFDLEVSEDRPGGHPMVQVHHLPEGRDLMTYPRPDGKDIMVCRVPRKGAPSLDTMGSIALWNVPAGSPLLLRFHGPQGGGTVHLVLDNPWKPFTFTLNSRT
jgi:beta-lactamase regulating signal transducer with metallopeptidase domain